MVKRGIVCCCEDDDGGKEENSSVIAYARLDLLDPTLCTYVYKCRAELDESNATK